MPHRINGEQGVVFGTAGNLFTVQGWPTVCRDENGTLYAVASSFRMQHVCPFGKTAMFISRNNGKTWTKPIIINDSYLDDRDVGILYLGNGKMLVTWFDLPAKLYGQGSWYDEILNNATERERPLLAGMMDTFSRLNEEDRRGGCYVMLSDDYGVTWSEKIRVPVSSPHGPNLCADGTLIILGQVIIPCDGEETDSIVAYASTDGGRTWERRGLCDKPAEFSWKNFAEPHVIELPDGTLLGAIRAEGEEIFREETASGSLGCGMTIFITRSTDGGRTWSVWERLPVNGAPPHLMMHSSGALICAYCRRLDPIGQRAVISRDGGKTWSDEYILADSENHPDAGYPSTVELDDGCLLTVYYETFFEPETQYRNSAVRYVKWCLDEKP